MPNPDEVPEFLRHKAEKETASQVTAASEREMPEPQADPTPKPAIDITCDREHGVVRIGFGTPVEWLALKPEMALRLAQAIAMQATKLASSLSGWRCGEES